MPDEAIKEAAATREKRPGSRLASREFFYLVERLDRLDEKWTSKIENEIRGLDEKLTGQINALDTRLIGEIKAVNGRINGLDSKLTGQINGLDSKLTGQINGLDAKIQNLDTKFSNKFNNLQQWMIGLIVTVIIGAGGIIVMLALALRH